MGVLSPIINNQLSVIMIISQMTCLSSEREKMDDSEKVGQNPFSSYICYRKNVQLL